MADPKITLETVIDNALDKTLKEVHTMLPAIVTKVDYDTQLIECQPTIQRKLNGELVNLPILVDVPLRFFKVNIFAITAPIVEGDYVCVMFAERSIDTWLASGDVQDPQDIRRHSLSDGFAIPYMYPQTDVIGSFDDSNFQIRLLDGSASFTLTSKGDIFLNGDQDTTIGFSEMLSAFNEFRSDFNSLVSIFNSHVHPGVETGAGSTSTTTTSGSTSTADMGDAEVENVFVTPKGAA